MPTVAGWVFEENLVRFLEQLSRYVGYRYDVWDEAALLNALEDTDDESETAWFRYPIPGLPPLDIALALAIGGTVVSVQVDGDIDQVLQTRINTMLDLL